jgi:CelD/BcsL family acetyltransferase involved in cellulose biosynthesis
VIEIVSTLEGLEALRDDWVRLGAPFLTPLLQHDWFMACARTLHDEHDIRVIVLRNGGTVVAIAPLALYRTPPATWLSVMGTTRLHEPSGVLYESQEALEQLVDGLLSMGLPLCLERLPFGTVIDQTLQARAGGRQHLVVRRTGRSCHLAFGGDWAAFYARIGTKSRTGIRIKARKASEHGEVVIEEYGAGLAPAALPVLLRQAYAVEASSWKGSAGSALLQQPRLRAFFDAYFAAACAAGTLRVYFYRVGGQLIAMHICVEHGRRLWFLKTGYDPEWRRLSPGLHLAMEILKRSIDSGLAGCEFLGSDEAWQHTWPVETRQYCSVLGYPRSLRGLCAGAATAVAYVRNRHKLRQRAAAAVS